jgi:nucleotide-binding universal stress UspA family protein
MYRYKRILVPFELGDHDIELVRYVSMITRMAKSEKVYFVHVLKNLEIPESIRKEYPQIIIPVDEYAKAQMKELVELNYDGCKDTQFEFEVAEGDHLANLLRLVRIKLIDLVVVGRKRKTGKLSKQLARKAPCSVLIFPEENRTKLTRILVATDFSKHAKNALDVALAFASASGIKELLCMHAYEVPLGYHKTGKSYEDFAEIMKGNAVKDFQEFSGTVETKGVELKPVFVLDKKTDHAVCETIDKESIDLLVLGSRGRSTNVALLLGSLTEKLIDETNVPLIAVKEKGDGLNLVDALLERMMPL